MSVLVKQALKAIDAAQDVLQKILRTEYCVGDPITWEAPRGGNCRGTVVEYGYDDRLKVRNNKTGREYWIIAANIQ